MLLLPRSTPLPLLQYQALLSRMPKTHKKYEQISFDAANYSSGHSGEKKMDYYYDFLPPSVDILHQLLLHSKYNHYRFQIDTLLLTPSFAAVLEIKNHAGELFFDPHYAQMIRTLEGVTTVFPCPLQQAIRQKFQLASLLKFLKLPPLPIYTHVFVANSFTRISSETPIEQVSHAAKLPQIVQNWQNEHTKPFLTSKEYNLLSKYLLANNLPDVKNLIERYQLSAQDIRLGIQCEACQQFAMQRVRGIWKCPSCSFRSNNAHRKSLEDYIHLNGKTISIKQAQEWLLLPNPITAKKILTPHAKISYKENRTTYYKINL
ncbi:nuclease-related domain-containing protein [Alkalicoccus daliensis]|uniref:Nuclease-related domain-containing protein n=1 Tax=Alkalicoccus daliensis TaxID=745820 RepID=A0A1H0L7S0_9BACI|nr:nuclease-related domain-containing protein [Alkalicoccus daliensis]SDO64267.1 Nuclease-related domain-containing protein [Alkalicoccus daliensis]